MTRRGVTIARGGLTRGGLSIAKGGLFRVGSGFQVIVECEDPLALYDILFAVEHVFELELGNACCECISDRNH